MGIQVKTGADKPVGGRISFEADERRNGFGRVVFVLALAGFLFNVYAFYPGLVSSDSADQYAQALRHAYADWHPPVMAMLWSALLPVFPGATGMLLLISASLWGGIGLLAARASAAFGRRGLLVLGVPFLPVVINFSGVVWKDVLHATLWILACGLLIGDAGGAARSRHLLRRTAAVLLILIGILIRSNAVFAAVPLLLWTFRDLRPVRATLAAIAGLILCFVLNSLLGKVVPVDHTHPLSSVQTYNLAAISHYTQVNQFPGEWTPEQTEKITQHCYMDSSWNSYAWGDGGPDDCSFVMHELVKQHYWGSATLTRTWLTRILQHPKAYLRSRLDNYQALLKHPEITHYIDQAQVIDGDKAVPATALKPVTMLIARYSARWVDSPLSAPKYWCLAAALALIWLARVWRTVSDAAKFAYVMLTSALIYSLTYFPAGVASDLRYFYWSYIGIAAALVIVLCDATRRQPQPPSPVVGRTPLPLTALSVLLAVTTLLTTWGRI